ncbi:MAG: DNA polymerase III subunit delta [Streptococcaceae bacterium]|jgi:DNA polymerase-3 subunit delta|nr:DNA polymerase III subunit delta [Streptococcaceae bacterium]
MTLFDDFDKILADDLPPVLAIYGENDELVRALKDKLFAAVKFDSSNLSQSYFDFAETATDAGAALEELESLPFFDEQHLVIFENLSNLTAQKKSSFDEKQLVRFEAYLENPVPSTQLVIILHQKLDARLKLSKKLKKMATCIETAELKPAELQALFAHEKLERQVLARILEKANYGYAAAQQAISLLKAYAGNRAITLEDVEKVVPKSLSDKIFDLSEFVFTGNTQKARELVQDLTTQGEDIIKILGILTSTFRLYFQVKLLSEKGQSESQMTDFLKIHPYRVKLARGSVRKLSKHYLQNALKQLIALDFAIKTSAADKAYLFDLAIIKLSTGM